MYKLKEIFMDTAVIFFEKNIKEILEDKFFLTVIIGTLFENILFILLLSDGNAVRINIKTALINVPPILVYIAFTLIPYSFGFLFKGRGRKLSFIAINLLISMLLIFDLWYYRSDSAFLNYYMLDMTSNLDGLSSSILAMFRPIDLVFLINTMVLTAFFIVEKGTYKEARMDISKFCLLFLIPVLYLAYNHVKIDKYQRGYVNQILLTRTWSQNQMMYNLTPLGYHIVDFFNYEQDKKTYVLTNQEKNQITDYYAYKEKSLPKNDYSGIFKGKNLLVIQVESMENFIINQKVGNQEITPNLNRLLSNSFYFSNYHEQTYNGTTSDATFVSNTSMLPVLVGNNNFNYPYNDYNSLPKLLKKEGYNTYSLHGEKGTYWNWMTAEKHLGFDTCLDITQFNSDEIIGLGLSDRTMLSQAVEKIKKQKQPFYSFMITLTSHSPFTLPKDQVTINIPDNLKGTKTGGFIESIHYTDAMLGKFMQELDREGLLDNTVVAIYGDHEGIHKFFEEEVQKLNIQDSWKNNDRRVPLIIYSKGLTGIEIDVNGGQIDFLPTISTLLGVDEKEYDDTALGRNLLNTNKDYVVLTNRTYRGAVISEDEMKKYINVLNTSNIMIKTNYFKGR